MSPDSRPITELLAKTRSGDHAAREMLLRLVHVDLLRLARRSLAAERAYTPPPDALISELFLRLFGAQRPPELNDRQHFYRVAARQMRRILLDHARSRTAAKRDGQLTRVPGEDLPADPTGFGNPGHLDLDRALDGLAALDPRAAAVVELRYYAGLSEREVAALQNVSPSTVRRDWDFARAWLLARLSGSVS